MPRPCHKGIAVVANLLFLMAFFIAPMVVAANPPEPALANPKACAVVMKDTLPPCPAFYLYANATDIFLMQGHSLVSGVITLNVDLWGWKLSTPSHDVDSVVWAFRDEKHPGVTIEGNLDPTLGWVYIGKSDACTWSSWIRWDTDWYKKAAPEKAGATGYGPYGDYVVVGWVYESTGRVCHSEPLPVSIGVSVDVPLDR